MVLGITISSIIFASIQFGDQQTTNAQEINSPFPLFWPTFFTYGERIPALIYPGDNVQIGMFIKNENKISTNMTFITEIIAPEGFVEAIQISEGILSTNNETIKLVNYWKPERDSAYHVEAFLLENKTGLLQLLSEKLTTDITVRSRHNNDVFHDLRVELNVDHSDSYIAGQALNGSIELVNFASHPESVRIEPESSLSFRPKGMNVSWPIINDCIFWPGLKLDNSIVLPGNGGRIKLNDGDKLPIPFTVDHDDIYDLAWGGRVLVQETKGTDCYYLSSPSVDASITAPSYDNIKLVLDADKESYLKNEPVRFTIFVENNSDEPFLITLDEIMIHIRDIHGNGILWFTAGLSPVAAGQESGIPSVVIKPHSKYTFENIGEDHQGTSFWDWNQRNLTPEGMPVPMEPGTYQAYATFTSPPMKSDAVTILLQ